MLRALGHERIATYHLNEGHAALLVLALLEQVRATPHGLPTYDDLARVRERCVFTTHTPVPAGHDCFGLDLAHDVLGAERVATLRALDLTDHDAAEHDPPRAARDALHQRGRDEARRSLARDVPGRRDPRDHQRRPRRHLDLAAVPSDLFDRHLPGWRRDNWQLRQAVGIPLHEIADAHAAAKHALIERVAHATGKLLDPNRFTIGIARRATAYKRNDLILRDAERLAGSRSVSAGSRSCSAAKRIRATGTAKR